MHTHVARGRDELHVDQWQLRDQIRFCIFGCREDLHYGRLERVQHRIGLQHEAVLCTVPHKVGDPVVHHNVAVLCNTLQKGTFLWRR